MARHDTLAAVDLGSNSFHLLIGRVVDGQVYPLDSLRGFPRGAVRAVGTNALRVAKNAPQLLREARETLGFPIEVIAGREEARLIYLGVAHSTPPAPHRRLVVDVGGGSTECIVGTIWAA